MFGSSGFAQGYWRLSDWGMANSSLIEFIESHLDLGIEWTDHADIYGDYRCESLFGSALQAAPHLRDQVKIVTKCDIVLEGRRGVSQTHNFYDTSYEHIVGSAEQSLRNLHVDKIDLLLLHRPDLLMNIDEVARAFDHLISTGKVKEVGVSNFSQSQFDLLKSVVPNLKTNQVEINPLNFECLHDGSVDRLYQNRLRPMAWSCLAGGRIFQPQTEQAQRVYAAIEVLAERHGVSMDQIVYRWVRMHPSNPLVVLGSGKTERIRTALESESIALTREEWYGVWIASKGHAVP